MSDTLATINVDQLNNAVSRAVGLSRLADLSSTASKLDCQNESCSTATSTTSTSNSHVFVKPSTSNSSKRKRQTTTVGEACVTPSAASTVHVSTIKPNPVSLARNPKRENAGKGTKQHGNSTALLPKTTGSAKPVVTILPRTTDNGSPQTTIQVPVLPTLAPASKIISAYLPSPTNPSLLSKITMDNKTFHMLPKTSSSTGIAAIPQTLSSQCGSIPCSMSAPQDLLAAATQAAIPHLITQYPKQPDLSSAEVATNNTLVKVISQPMPVHSQSVTSSGISINTATPIQIANTCSLTTNQQPLTIYQIVSTPTTMSTHTSPGIVSVTKANSVVEAPTPEHAVPTGAYANVAKLADNDRNQKQTKRKTVYTLLLGNSSSADSAQADQTTSDLDRHSDQQVGDQPEETPENDEPDQPDRLFRNLFCIECDAMNDGNSLRCTHHPTAAVVPDTSILSRARMSLPFLVEIREDAKQKHGVFTREFIPAKTRFGPLIGFEIPQEETSNIHSDSCYLWKIYKTQDDFRIVDCTDENTSNWMRFVRTAHTSAEQNLVAYQEKDNIFFISLKDIPPCCELLYWYSKGYAKVLGKNLRPEDWFTCGACKKQFEDMHSVTQHIRYSHPDTTKRKWKCEVCQRAFASAAKLNTHKMCHAGLKPHTCHECGKCFTDQSNLRIHMIIHSGERRFICSICNRAFRQKAHLKSHMLTHTGEKRMQCQYCSKLFARRSDVRVHEMQHTKEKVYKCLFPDCHKEFYKIQSLNKHHMVHSGIRDHQCEQCKKSFVTRYHLKRHMKSCQGTEQSDSALSSRESENTNIKNVKQTSEATSEHDT